MLAVITHHHHLSIYLFIHNLNIPNSTEEMLKMVYLDACPNKEIHQYRFHLGLTTLKIIPTNQAVPLNSQINKA